jgi:hypothetical protein
MSGTLSPELREFIYRYCATLPALEALILLRASPDVLWAAEGLRARLPGLGERESADLLAAFHWHGFLAAETLTTYRYRPSPELEPLVAQLAAAWASARLEVLAEIGRLATLTPIRSFAAAFRIKKDPTDG